MARLLLLHLTINWPAEFSANLWPFALNCAVHICNHVLKLSGLSPMELFCSTRIDCKPLKQACVFGCPVHVLDPRLQDGKKIPKWEPRSRLGQFLGFLAKHASNVGLIQNVETGCVSPQFHVMHDERFQTVASEHNVDLSETWIDLFVNSCEHHLEGHDPEVDGPLPGLHDTWVPKKELPKKEGSQNQGKLEADESGKKGKVASEPQKQGKQPTKVINDCKLSCLRYYVNTD